MRQFLLVLALLAAVPSTGFAKALPVVPTPRPVMAVVCMTTVTTGEVTYCTKPQPIREAVLTYNMMLAFKSFMDVQMNGMASNGHMPTAEKMKPASTRPAIFPEGTLEFTKAVAAD